MPTLLQINSCVNVKSTGRIAEGIGTVAINAGWKSYIAYGRESIRGKSELIKIGNIFSVYSHFILTRLFDLHGYGSWFATKLFLRKIDKIKPDIIHLHNIHGYYINIFLLFEYLKKKDIPVIWTLHDCWAMTGHCFHYAFIGCDKWKTGCFKCPLKKDYPSSYGLDLSKVSYNRKKKYFSSLTNLTLVPVSDWLGNQYRYSFLSNFPIKRIYNGIDINQYYPILKSDVREKYEIKNDYLIIGVGSHWSEMNGFSDYISLFKLLPTDFRVMLVGLSDDQIKQLPIGMIGIKKTNSINELAQIYSTADVFVNLTYLDSFPTTNLEALACGTPVITYRTGGSPESITNDVGFVVEQANIIEVMNAILELKKTGKDHLSLKCRERAVSLYNKENQFSKYIDLYNLIKK